MRVATFFNPCKGEGFKDCHPAMCLFLRGQRNARLEGHTISLLVIQPGNMRNPTDLDTLHLCNRDKGTCRCSNKQVWDLESLHSLLLNFLIDRVRHGGLLDAQPRYFVMSFFVLVIIRSLAMSSSQVSAFVCVRLLRRNSPRLLRQRENSSWKSHTNNFEKSELAFSQS